MDKYCASKTHIVDDAAHDELGYHGNRGGHNISTVLDDLAFLFERSGTPLDRTDFAISTNCHTFDISRSSRTDWDFFLSTGNASRANAAAKAVVKGSSVRFHILESD